MPNYDFSCPATHDLDGKKVEGFQFEALKTIDAPNPPCELCGGPTEKVWSFGTRRFGEDSTWPRVTKMFGKPMVVDSATHMRKLGEARGWRLRDDNAWLDEGDYHGAKWQYDPRKGRKGWVQSYGKSDYEDSKNAIRTERWV